MDEVMKALNMSPAVDSHAAAAASAGGDGADSDDDDDETVSGGSESDSESSGSSTSTHTDDQQLGHSDREDDGSKSSDRVDCSDAAADSPAVNSHRVADPRATTRLTVRSNTHCCSTRRSA